MTTLISTRAAVFVFALLVGCDDASRSDASDRSDDSAASSSSDGGIEFDAEAVISAAAQYRSTMTRINDEPLSSRHGLAAAVNVYVPPDLVELYLSIDPEVADPAVAFPPGAIIVKEHLDEVGAVAGLTVMAQRDPESATGGWWWALVDADGSPQQTGAVGFCIGCHREVEAKGWAFGVAADDRVPR